MPQNTLMARLRVYAPNGALQGSLPYPLSWEMGVPLNDMPSLTLTYPQEIASVSTLMQPIEVAVEIRNPRTGVYQEYPGCRFINLRRSQDLISRPGTVSLTMPSYGWQLRKVRFVDASTMNREGRRRFTNATPGFILGRIIDESQERGNIPGLTRSFTGVIDSNGAQWTNRVTAEYDLGQDAWSILDAMSRQGIVDWRFDGRQFDVYVADTALRRNLAEDDGLIFHPYADHMEEPSERTWEEVSPTLLVVGDENASLLVEAEEGDVDSPWGRWEESYSAGGVSSEATMRLLAQRVLETRSRSRLQLTKRMAWRDGSPVPLVDYRPGDMVRARTDTGNQFEPVRIHQITLTSADEGGVIINLVLNDRFTDRALRTERWLNRVTGQGGPGEGGGSGAEPRPPEPDVPEPTGREPAQPQNPEVSSSSYFDEAGNPVAAATLSFNAVVTDVDGESLTPDRYHLYGRRSDLPFDLRISGEVQHPEDATAGDRIAGDVGPLDAGHTYHFAARAISQAGFPGQWSESLSLFIEYPTDLPPVPSIPILSTRLGTVKVEWDGLDDGGLEMPARFREVQVEMSLTGADPWTRMGEIFQGGSALIVTGQDSQLDWGIGDTIWFRFRSRDSASNVSSEGESDSIVVVGVEGPDVEADTITANNVRVGSLTGREVRSHSLSADRLSIGDTANIVSDPLLSDIGDPDPDNPGETVGGLNRHRVEVALDNSATGSEWKVDGGFATLTNVTSSDNYNRFGLVNNIILMPGLTNGDPIERPGLAAQITRPAGAEGNAGNVKGRIRVTFSLEGSEMPGDAQTLVGLRARYYNREGVVVGGAPLIITERTFTDNEDVILQSNSGSFVPETATGIIPYVHVSHLGGVPEGVTVQVSEFEVWQEGSVLIGDGMIRAPHMQANSINANSLEANAITAKHTIRSALYEMQSQSGDTTLYVSNNANLTGQAGIRWVGPSTVGLQPGIFMVDSAGSGDWRGNSLVHMGPERESNSSGRVDIQQSYGVTQSFMRRHWGGSTQNAQGIVWETNNSRLRIRGALPVQTNSADMFRGVNFSSGSAATVWTISWGASNHIYLPVATPSLLASENPDASSATCLVARRNADGFRVVSSQATPRMHAFCFTGGVDIG